MSIIQDKCLDNAHRKKKVLKLKVILSNWSTRFTCTLSVNVTLNMITVTGTVNALKKKVKHYSNVI